MKMLTYRFIVVLSLTCLLACNESCVNNSRRIQEIIQHSYSPEAWKELEEMIQSNCVSVNDFVFIAQYYCHEVGDYRSAIEYARKVKNRSELRVAYDVIARSYQKIGQLDSAIAYTYRLEHLYENPTPDEIGLVYAVRGWVYEESHVFDSAGYYYDKTANSYSRSKKFKDDAEIFRKMACLSLARYGDQNKACNYVAKYSPEELQNFNCPLAYLDSIK